MRPGPPKSAPSPRGVGWHGSWVDAGSIRAACGSGQKGPWHGGRWWNGVRLSWGCAAHPHALLLGCSCVPKHPVPPRRETRPAATGTVTCVPRALLWAGAGAGNTLGYLSLGFGLLRGKSCKYMWSQGPLDVWIYSCAKVFPELGLTPRYPWWRRLVCLFS